MKKYYIQIIEVSAGEIFIALWKHPRTEAQIVAHGVQGFEEGRTAPIYGALAEIQNCSLTEIQVKNKNQGSMIRKFLLENFQALFPGKISLNVKPV